MTLAERDPPLAPSPAGPLARKALLLLAMVTLLTLGVIALRRTAAVWNAMQVAPGVAQTSGCEEESLFAVWRSAHGEPVFRDTSRVPFSSAYFNWLFYAAYGAVAKSVGPTAGTVAGPTASRALTLIGGLFGSLILSLHAWRLLRPQGLAAVAAGTAVGVFVFFGPLVGWWVLTVRPDVWALACEAGALVWLLSFHRTRPWLATIGTAVGCYAAWGFKPNCLQALATALLFLAFRRRWSQAALLLALSVGAWAATLSILGPDYRAALTDTALNNRFYLGAGLGNLTDFGLKAAPLLLALLLWIGPCPRLQASDSLGGDTLSLAQLGLPLTLGLAFVGGCKYGAASTYYMTVTLLLALLGLAGLAQKLARFLPHFALVGAILGLGVFILNGGASLGLDQNSAQLAKRWSVWQNAPEPRFSSDLRLNLPWLNPRSPPLVLAFNYASDRDNRRRFEAGGVGGLIRARYFAALLLHNRIGAAFDGTRLDGYERRQTVGDMTLYVRHPPPGGPGGQ